MIVRNEGHACDLLFYFTNKGKKLVMSLLDLNFSDEKHATISIPRPMIHLFDCHRKGISILCAANIELILLELLGYLRR